MHPTPQRRQHKRGATLFAALILGLLTLQLILAESCAGEQTNLGTIMVTATRTSEPLTEISQSVQIISRADIEASPATDLYQILAQISGVDVRSRGTSGAQADVSIRGGNFEQTLILLNGISMSNPQTGHHNLDIPVHLNDIERIEVLKGPSARIYGANAMSGAINIITRTAAEPEMQIELDGGSYNYTHANLSGTFKTGEWGHRVSAGHRYSSGFDADEPTGLNTKSLSTTSRGSFNNADLEIGAGYLDKNFGASRFYFDAPEQKEHTKTLLGYSAMDIYTSTLHWRPHVSYQRHEDIYSFANSGQWDTNSSTTDKIITALTLDAETAYGLTSIGANLEWERIVSNSLGDHNRGQQSVFINQRLPWGDRATLGGGLSAVHYSDWGWEYWPGADLNLKVYKHLTWFVSAAKSFRIPTYTEMYYNTPMNIGSPNLKAEEAWTWETGLRYLRRSLEANLALFQRDSDNLIEWVRSGSDQPWEVHNIASSTTTGVETGIRIRQPLAQIPLLQQLACTYTYLDTEQDAKGLETKYVLNNLRHQLHTYMDIDWLSNVQQRVALRYEQRLHGDSSTVVDTSLRWEISGSLILKASVTNLFDTDYIEAGFAPAPGRWIQGGISWRI
ncbi:MAG: TonB-dependent receptor [Desulfuromonadaceae bacterium]|nr:TonB-dependent receptor [Desulfuromonas sp.]MDY0184316.1 TonB-dependent receptor [Desulfuromonadaceae bacterium]